jgi:hypothetical protein
MRAVVQTKTNAGAIATNAEDIDYLQTDSHTHDNKSTLDTITSGMLLSSTEATDLTDGGNTILHTHNIGSATNYDGVYEGLFYGITTTTEAGTDSIILPQVLGHTAMMNLSLGRALSLEIMVTVARDLPNPSSTPRAASYHGLFHANNLSEYGGNVGVIYGDFVLINDTAPGEISPPALSIDAGSISINASHTTVSGDTVRYMWLATVRMSTLKGCAVATPPA